MYSSTFFSIRFIWSMRWVFRARSHSHRRFTKRRQSFVHTLRATGRQLCERKIFQRKRVSNLRNSWCRSHQNHTSCIQKTHKHDGWENIQEPTSVNRNRAQHLIICWTMEMENFRLPTAKAAWHRVPRYWNKRKEERVANFRAMDQRNAIRRTNNIRNWTWSWGAEIFPLLSKSTRRNHSLRVPVFSILAQHRSTCRRNLETDDGIYRWWSFHGARIRSRAPRLFSLSEEGNGPKKF